MGEKAPYDPSCDIFRFRRPAIAVDVVLLTLLHDDLQVALIQRQDEPYHGAFALPGRFVRYDEKIEDTARIALEEKGNIKTDDIYLEQLYTFGQDLFRDSRIRTISVVYYALVNAETVTGQEGHRFTWHSVYDLPRLAFDHKDIILFCVQRLREKLFKSDIVFKLLPEEFTLSELQRAFEIILDERLDKRNFRKKVKELFVLEDVKRTKMTGAHRPAKLYRFVKMRG